MYTKQKITNKPTLLPITKPKLNASTPTKPTATKTKPTPNYKAKHQAPNKTNNPNHHPKTNPKPPKPK